MQNRFLTGEKQPRLRDVWPRRRISEFSPHSPKAPKSRTSIPPLTLSGQANSHVLKRKTKLTLARSVAESQYRGEKIGLLHVCRWDLSLGRNVTCPGNERRSSSCPTFVNLIRRKYRGQDCSLINEVLAPCERPKEREKGTNLLRRHNRMCTRC